MTGEANMLAQVQRLIAGQVADLGDPTVIRPDQMLYEYGVDSLAAVSLMVGLAEEMGVDLEDFASDIDPPTKVGDLCDLAARFLASRETAVSGA